MVNASAGTWAQATAASRSKAAPTVGEQDSGDPVAIASKNVGVALQEDGETILLTLIKDRYLMDLDTAGKLVEKLSAANPNVDSGGASTDD